MPDSETFPLGKLTPFSADTHSWMSQKPLCQTLSIVGSPNVPTRSLWTRNSCLLLFIHVQIFSIPQRFLPRDFAGAKKCIAELENNPIWVCARSHFHHASVCDLQVLAWLRRQPMISIKIAKDSFSYVSDSDLVPFCHQIPFMFTRITNVGYTK